MIKSTDKIENITLAIHLIHVLIHFNLPIPFEYHKQTLQKIFNLVFARGCSGASQYRPVRSDLGWLKGRSYCWLYQSVMSPTNNSYHKLRGKAPHPANKSIGTGRFSRLLTLVSLTYISCFIADDVKFPICSIVLDLLFYCYCYVCKSE